MKSARNRHMRFTPGLDDLATKFPLLLGEWHPQNNGEKTPSDFSAGSHTKVWWLCAKGHEWLTSIEARTRLAGPTSCPYCSGRQVIPGQNDLGTVAPSLASQFSAKNKVSVSAVNPTSKTNYIWVCPHGHEWTGTAKSRTAGRDCPICDGKVLTSGENDLATKLPELAEYWDFEKNKQKPSDVSASARNSFQWTCSKGHEWRSTIYTLVKNPTCPRCRNADGRPKAQRIGSSFPSLEKEWNSVKNFGLTFSSMGISDVMKYWWICDKGHEWQAAISNRTRGRNGGTGCPVCANRVIVVGYNDLETTDPSISREWNTLRNSPLTARDIVAGAAKKYWWICDKGHEWQAAPRFRTRNVGAHGCPYCGNQKVLVGFNDLASQRPDLAAEWNAEKNKPLTATEVSPGSHKKVWWTCPEGHAFPMSISGRVKGNWCTVCKNMRIVSGVNDLETINPMLAKQWHPSKNLPVTPAKVSPSSSAKFWWICDKGHVWKTSVAHRANDRQCPACVSKGYNQTKPGLFYFIQHSGKHSRKVGITNISTRTKRIDGWAERGWKIIKVVESENGSAIADLETEMFRWIRNDLGLPRYLEQRDMDGMGGWSETFSDDDEPSNIEVIAKIDKVWAEVQEKHNS